MENGRTRNKYEKLDSLIDVGEADFGLLDFAGRFSNKFVVAWQDGAKFVFSRYDSKVFGRFEVTWVSEAFFDELRDDSFVLLVEGSFRIENEIPGWATSNDSSAGKGIDFQPINPHRLQGKAVPPTVCPWVNPGYLLVLWVYQVAVTDQKLRKILDSLLNPIPLFRDFLAQPDVNFTVKIKRFLP